MAGRHRKPPSWRTFLTTLVRSRNRVRTAALRAEVAQLRGAIARLETELAAARATAVGAPADRAAPARGLAIEAPLVRLAFSGVAVDRRPDTALTEIVLPERALLDPREDRSEDLDLVAQSSAPAPVRRTA